MKYWEITTDNISRAVFLALAAFALPVVGLCAEEPEVDRVKSPLGTFYFETQVFNRSDFRIVVSIVSTKDPALREVLPGFGNVPHTVKLVTISPDENWIFFYEHIGSHAQPNHLYRRKGIGLRFEPEFSGAKDFDDEAWKFFCNVEQVPRRDATLVPPAEFIEWSSDSSRLLFSLTSGLGVTEKDFGRRNDPTRPGVWDWRAYYNLKTQRFELDAQLRELNKAAHKRWRER